MRVFGRYVNARVYHNNRNDENDGCGFLFVLILALTCFSVINPTFFLFWIPVFVAYPMVKSFIYRKDKVKKEKDYE